ncbi:MAG: DNA polymerase III subunit alpha [Firmicutes bacterium]|jgi:DNA polymerase-3 subunit alpha|nr:DNA polymerase III subunit alpha [Bacillota bacterium]
MSSFVHLHVHSEFSLLDGTARITELVSTAKAMSMPALAVTDHGAMFGLIDFYKEATNQGIKPILGCEVYVAPRTRFDRDPVLDKTPYHLVLLARNRTGFQNLIKIVTAGYLEGFYYKPRVDRQLLEGHAEGIVALSACLAGEIPSKILTGNMEEAISIAEHYASVFGTDNFYLELQNHDLPEQETVNEALRVISDKTDLPMVATNDVHYIKKEDAMIHDVLLCVQTNKTIYDQNRLRFKSDQFYFKSPEEMKELWSDYPGALENTIKIAERCNLELEFGRLKMPDFPMADDVAGTETEYLRKLCMEGLKERYGTVHKAHRERLNYELEVIEQMGYCSYFLIVWDYIRYAREQGILVGPGRGSAAGSLVAYSLKITDVDPLRYGLLFERFLNPERVSMPDIDIDICDDRRDEVIAYVINKYGAEHAVQIATFGTMAARSAIKDVGRALDIEYKEVDRLTKLFPEEKTTIEKVLAENKYFQEYYRQEENRKLIDISRALEGLPRHTGRHAAGVIVSREPLLDHVPLQKLVKENKVVTQFPMETLEDIGLVKLDLLGLKTLNVILNTLQHIEGRYGKKIDIERIPLNDRATYELLSKGETDGVFQLESRGMKNVLQDLKPNKFEDIIAVVALYRPGPMDQIPVFVNSKHHREQIKYFHPALENILKETYGVIVYQEQIMQIAAEIAGFTLGQADLLRRAIGKKEKGIIDEQRELFIKGCVDKGYSAKLGHDIYDLIEKFASYGFNKSHAAAYALISYQTAYLKANYPVEFMAALLTSVMDKSDKVSLYISDCIRQGIEVLLPDVNESAVNFSVVGDRRICFGLSAVKNLGSGAIENIISVREEGLFRSLTDFCSRVDLRACNKKVVESLVKAGAFDNIEKNRAALLAILDDAIAEGQRIQRDRRNGQISMMALFHDDGADHQITDILPDIPPFTVKERLFYEKEALGFYISGHPLDQYRLVLESLPNLTRCAELAEIGGGKRVSVGGIINSVREIYTVRNQPMGFAILEDLTGSVEVTIFTDLYGKNPELIQKDQPIIIRGNTQIEHDMGGKEEVRILAKEIVPLPLKTKQLFIRVDLKEEEYIKLTELRKLLYDKNGDIPVYLDFKNLHKMMLLPERFWARNEPRCFDSIRNLLGDDSLEFKEIKSR